MAEKEQDVEQKQQQRSKKRKRVYDETRVEDTGEGPLYPPKGGSYIHK